MGGGCNLTHVSIYVNALTKSNIDVFRFFKMSQKKNIKEIIVDVLLGCGKNYEDCL